MEKSLVNINTADEAELCELYDVGPVLARRIIKYRRANGYFFSPEDLAKIEGISKQLAVTLSPQINWNVPEQMSEAGRRNWDQIYLPIIMICLATPYIVTSCQSFFHDITNINEGIKLRIISVTGLYILSFTAIVYSQLLTLIVDLSLDKYFLRKVSKTSLKFTFFGLFGLIINSILQIVNYFIDSKQGFFDLLINQQFMNNSIMIFLSLFFGGPIVLVYFNSKLAYNKIVSTILNIVWIIFVPLMAYIIWINRNDTPIWELIFFIIISINFIILGFNQIKGDPYLLFLSKHFSEINNNDKIISWEKWINIQLPNPEQQKSLQEALNEMHPSSKVNKFIGYILLSASGWILVTVLGAIISWFVNNYMNVLFHTK